MNFTRKASTLISENVAMKSTQGNTEETPTLTIESYQVCWHIKF